jgi:beta-galactosidase
VRTNSLLVAWLLLALTPTVTRAQPEATKGLDDWFSPRAVSSLWTKTHCDLESDQGGALRATLWKGYGTTGFETSPSPAADWSAWKSFRFDVENPYGEPFSVFVRLSNHSDHPVAETYTGGTFDGYVVGPGHSSVQISLETMQSREERAVDPSRIAYVGIFFQPLFLRDGMDLKFTADRTFRLSHPRLSRSQATLQKQPYGDLLFRETDSAIAGLRREVDAAIDGLQKTIDQARRQKVETACAEIYPFLSGIAFNSRLVAFWQDRAQEQRRALEFLLKGARQAQQDLQKSLEGKESTPRVPAIPEYAELTVRDGYFRLDGDPVLLFGMLYNRRGPLLRWFANSQTDYGTQLIAGGTRHDVERQPIWNAYHKYPDTHRVGWDHADHIIRDRSSWEVLGPPVNVCLESPHSREAVARMIETFERARAGDRDHLVQNLGYEYTYVCYCDYTRRLWEEWLSRKHRDIGAANRIWGTSFGNFAAVPMPRQENAASNRALWFDWTSFNLHRFIEQIRWTVGQIRRWEPAKPLTVGSPYFAFSPAFWTGVDEEELADSGVTGAVLEENYALDTLMPEYLHSLAGGKPVMDFEYHGVVHQILPSFLHGDAAISMWWWNDQKRWTPNEPINEWASSFPQSYTIPLRDIARAMCDALDVRRLGREITALGSAPRPVVLLYSKTSMLQQLPAQSSAMDTFPYLSALRRTYNASQSSGLYMGVTTEKKILAGDLQRRKILVLPAAEFVPGSVVAKMLSWVEGGGTLIACPDSLLADEYARPTGTLRSLGVTLSRREPPRLKRGETIVTEYNLPDLPRMPLLQSDRKPLMAGGMPLVAAGGRQILECKDCGALARFEDGSPALLRIRRGLGTIYWLAAPLEPRCWSRFLAQVATDSGLKPGLRVVPDDGGDVTALEYRVAVAGGSHLAYFYNNSDQDMRLSLQPDFPFERIIDRRKEAQLQGARLNLAARETALLEFR